MSRREPVIAGSIATALVPAALEFIEAFNLYDFTERQQGAVLSIVAILVGFFVRRRVSPTRDIITLTVPPRLDSDTLDRSRRIAQGE